jgi:ribosomal protection tetracycline resistance protein
LLYSLNLGILAHVDAGKTSLTERLLFTAGAIGEIGRVDDGSTQTDTLALERQRGITIRAAVASFRVGEVCVSLIDTPGHPDFIAEVERALGVLDGAVLVISAVEGVQAQTRVLMRTMRRLGIPVLIFVNKIDRAGADCEAVLRDIAAKLTPAIIPMGRAVRPGGRDAAWQPFEVSDPGFVARLTDLLTAHDDALLAEAVNAATAGTGPDLPRRRLRLALRAQAQRGLVHPVYFGSAITGAGIEALMAGMTELLPLAGGQAGGPPDGQVFKVERGPGGEKLAYVRMFSGTVAVREMLRYGEQGDDKVTAISVFRGGPAEQAGLVQAGQIARLTGLTGIQVGDRIGTGPTAAPGYFPPPTLETIVVPDHPAGRPALHAALTQLAEQDPLINLRQDEVRHDLLVSLYGEVQKEVIQAMLADDFGLPVTFRETTVICTERVAGTGEATELMSDPANPFKATVGLRVAPGAPGSGLQFRVAVERGSIPAPFLKAIEETAFSALRQGLRGWPVADGVVTLTRTGYVPALPSGWSNLSTTAGDFRNLTPLVMLAALRRAGTVVCEPVSSFGLEVPLLSVPAVMTALARLGAAGQTAVPGGASCVIEGEIPAARLHDLQQLLPALTSGEGLLETGFSGYRPVTRAAPRRPRTDGNPLSRPEYLLWIQRRRGRS